jgi:hypothetical protein
MTKPLRIDGSKLAIRADREETLPKAMFPNNNRVFGWGATGAEQSRPSFWGQLRPFSCLVEKIGLEWLRPSFLFGWTNELEECMEVFTPLVGPTCHRAYV